MPAPASIESVAGVTNQRLNADFRCNRADLPPEARLPDQARACKTAAVNLPRDFKG